MVCRDCPLGSIRIERGIYIQEIIITIIDKPIHICGMGQRDAYDKFKRIIKNKNHKF